MVWERRVQGLADLGLEVWATLNPKLKDSGLQDRRSLVDRMYADL